MTDLPNLRRLRRNLLDWYDSAGRDLPWRTRPGPAADAYAVWLSEIMLQQTTVATVVPYFEKFIDRWPTVEGLAAASLDDVLHAWQGLGYYGRARNLHECARTVVSEHGGVFPKTADELATLPGIGPYTSAAISAIAFGRPEMPVDGNIERVTARLFAYEGSLPGAKADLHDLARKLAPKARCGDFAQGLMDLGATVCRAKVAACPDCPIEADCLGVRSGRPERFPLKAARKPRPIRNGVAFWAVRGDGAVLLRRRPENGLLGGMMEIPSTEWRERRWTTGEAREWAPAAAEWRPVPGAVNHTFTHFHLELTVLAGDVPEAEKVAGVWCRPVDFSDHALPTVMKKVTRHVLAAARQSQ